MGMSLLPNIIKQGMTLISETTLSGATTTISNIPQNYNNLYAQIVAPQCASAGLFRIAPNNSTTACLGAGTTYNRTTAAVASMNFTYINSNISNIKASNVEARFALTIDRYTDTTNYKTWQFSGGFINSTDIWHAITFGGIMTPGTGGITSLVFSNSAGNLTGGTVYLYGVN
jgi:hypothetical protein